ncbi:MAG: glyoxalase [Clostridiales bacterium]|nr:glyoxalase [Clostridiales bacterium]
MTYDYDKEAVRFFLENQGQLFPETVAEDEDDAIEFLDICMAAVCDNIREVREYMDGYGVDITGMSKTELEEAEEVFCLPDGRYLVVMG